MALIQSIETAIKSVIVAQDIGITPVIANDSQVEPEGLYTMVECQVLTNVPENDWYQGQVVILVVDSAYDASSTIEAKADALRNYLTSPTFKTDLNTALTGVCHVPLITEFQIEASTEEGTGHRIEGTQFKITIT